MQQEKESAVFISANGVAKRYEITRDCVYKWIKAGAIPKPLKINGVSRWRIADLDLWDNSHQKGENQ